MIMLILMFTTINEKTPEEKLKNNKEKEIAYENYAKKTSKPIPTIILYCITDI